MSATTKPQQIWYWFYDGERWHAFREVTHELACIPYAIICPYGEKLTIPCGYQHSLPTESVCERCLAAVVVERLT